jgi:amino acid adenylation domain-containing protein
MSVNDSQCFINRFLASAQAQPDKIAIHCGGIVTSYGELLELVRRYAAAIKTQADANALVVFLPRDHRSIALFIACQFCGLPYVPVDLSAGFERLQKILANNDYVLVHEAELSFAPCGKQQFFHIDKLEKFPPTSAEPVNFSNEQLTYHETYRIYTSGSTGEPKGVMVAEAGCCNLLDYFSQLLQTSSATSLLSSTSFAFDIFYLEYTLPLACGGTLILMTNSEASSAQTVAQRLQAYQPDIFQATPSLCKCILPYLDETFQFNQLMVGGEALGSHLSRVLHQKARSLWNVYGPTETTVWSSSWLIEQAGDTRIGQPIANTCIYILDEAGEQVPQSEEGYIHIGGDGVALGYYQNPVLTEQMFIWKTIDGAARRLYNTRDIGFIDSEGCLNYLRRDGDFFKINGFRIDPGEIINQLEQHAQISEAAVLVDDQEQEPFLVAYIKPQDNTTVDIATIKDYLHQYLPTYMVPRFILSLQEFFYTISGKLDNKRMQNFYYDNKAKSLGRNQQPIADPLQRLLAKYIDVQGLRETDNFFRRGLTSMQAVSLHLDLLEYNPQLELYQLFESPSLKELRHCIDVTEPS